MQYIENPLAGRETRREAAGIQRLILPYHGR